MQIPGKLRRRLSEALVDAFTAASLARCVRDRLDERLDALVSGGNLRDKIHDLLGWAERQGRVGELVEAAAAEVPGNEKLRGAHAAFRAYHGKRAGEAAPAAGVRVSIARLPVTGGDFVAREDELARLDAAWADEATNVVSFVAPGGIGKSALVNRWLDGVAGDGWRGAERVLGWSFYSQGTDAAGASSEAFTEFALDWLGYEGEVITSPWKKGEVLARLVRAAPTLLILDGLEPLQHPPGGQTGRIKDPAVQALVRELAVENPGLCVITTRLAVADVAARAGAVTVDLEELPVAAGVELLRRLGVTGSATELEAAAVEFGGHALALSLLGTWLRDVAGGDVRRQREVPLLDEGIEQGGHARRVMRSYESWLGEGPELRLLSLLGLFDRPVEAEALAALRAAPPIPGLTEGLGDDDEDAWRRALARLRKARLVAAGDAGGVDAHPLVREHFGERLRESAPEAWRTGHERLYEHYKDAAPELPETLKAMLPLYAAVVHGCRAGRVQEALEEVYARRILRGGEHFSWHKLGAYGAELMALAGFFERPWGRPDPRLTAAAQAWILNEAGFVLRALGRLPEAVQPMRAGLEARIVEDNSKEAAISAGNLSELHLRLGDVAAAMAAGEESVELAERSGVAFLGMIERTILANSLHQAGRWDKSAAAFRRAEALQAESPPGYPRLFGVRGYWYCDLLLSRAEPADGSGLDRVEARYRQACDEVRERTGYAIKIAESSKWLLDIALDHLSLGRAHLGLALTSGSPADFNAAARHLDRALDGLRQSGYESFLPRGLVARATFRRLRAAASADGAPGEGPDAAASDLRAAEEIAERGHMRLHEADVHLEWIRLYLQAGDRDAARRHLERAREIIRETGYGRREREVAYLEGRLA